MTICNVFCNASSPCGHAVLPARHAMWSSRAGLVAEVVWGSAALGVWTMPVKPNADGDLPVAEVAHLAADAGYCRVKPKLRRASKPAHPRAGCIKSGVSVVASSGELARRVTADFMPPRKVAVIMRSCV